ncbi:hypothetical protein AAC387_Pa07g0552 [Persea americana]
MKLKADPKRNDRTQRLTSWRGASDPSSGNFSSGIDPQKLPQVVMWDGADRRWRSGPWNGRTFIGIPAMAYTYLNGCGPNGRCSMSTSPICNCLKGFEPKYIEEWSRWNWSGGCVRSKQLECEKNGNDSWKGDGFLKMDRIKVPDFADSMDGGSLKECEENCQKNCSCVAYAYDSMIGCIIWRGDLVDIQQFARGGVDLYIRLPASELDGNKDRKTVIISTVLPATLILMGCIYFLWRWRAKQREHKEHHIHNNKEGMLCFNMYNRVKAPNDSSDGSNTLNDGVKGTAGSELPLFGFSVVAIATNNFSDANKLGEGGFGIVYKGKLPRGQQIAVKRLSKKGEEKILIYEYMPNKSLDAFLFGPSTKEPLDWDKRFHIVEGIARGLLYLHRDSRLKIIHRDLKASNILLDEGLNPKISDFGMARILGEEQILARTTRVVGTYGYMSPEYAMQGRFSEKSDVFSFGVLLLEIVSGKRNTSFYQNEQTSNLLCRAWLLWNEGTALELIDPALGGHFQQEQVLRCIHLGLLCVQEFPKDRPSMSSVVFMLGDLMDIQQFAKGGVDFNIRLPASELDGSSILNDDWKGAAPSELPLFSFSNVAIATNNFSDENKLGEGGFGLVYKYILCVLLSHFWFVKTDICIEKNTPISTPAPLIMVNNGEKPEKFNSTEFKRWQQKMMFYLTTLNLARFLHEESPALIEGETDKQVVAAVEA